MQGFYEQFNEELARLLQNESSDTFKKKNWETGGLFDNDAFMDGKTMEGKGSVLIQVTTANGALPIEGARVTVFETDERGGAALANLMTDQSGRTPRVDIDAPKASYSQQPGNIRPFRNVNIKVEYPGYYVKENINVPVFDGIESIQPVSLKPLPEGTVSAEPEVVAEFEILDR